MTGDFCSFQIPGDAGQWEFIWTRASMQERKEKVTDHELPLKLPTEGDTLQWLKQVL